MFKFVPALLMEQMITPCTSKPKLVKVVSLPGRSSLASFNLSWGRDQSNRQNIWEAVENFSFSQLDFLFIIYILCCRRNKNLWSWSHLPRPPLPPLFGELWLVFFVTAFWLFWWSGISWNTFSYIVGEDFSKSRLMTIINGFNK